MASASFSYGCRAQHNQAPDRHHHGSANALHDAHDRELGKRMCRAAEQGSESEDGNRRGKDGA